MTVICMLDIEKVYSCVNCKCSIYLFRRMSFWRN